MRSSDAKFWGRHVVICDSGNRVFGGSGSSRIAFPECEAMRRARKHSAKPTRTRAILLHFRLSACIRVLHTGSHARFSQSFSKIFKRMSHRRGSSYSFSISLSSFEKSPLFIFTRPFLFYTLEIKRSFLLPGESSSTEQNLWFVIDVVGHSLQLNF